MTVQNHIDAVRRVIRWNVNESESNPIPLQVNH
jgi:hypothetical protein